MSGLQQALFTQNLLRAVEEGRVSPELAKNVLSSGVETALDFTPIVGDVKAVGYDLPQQVSEGDIVGGLFSLASMIPIVGDVAKKGYDFVSRMDLPRSIADINGEMAGATANTYDLVKQPEYFKRSKGIEYDVVEMSPDEYLDKSARLLGSTKENLVEGIQGGARYEDMVELATNSNMKVQMPYLDYARQTQEGNHRALVAKQLGADKIPVMIIKKVDK